jgi:hypothetical protein
MRLNKLIETLTSLQEQGYGDCQVMMEVMTTYRKELIK